MSVESLISALRAARYQVVALTDDGSDRLLVDAPKGALTPSLREALTAHKLELIIALKAQALKKSHEDAETKATGNQTAAEVSKTPSSGNVSVSRDASKGILEEQLFSLPQQFQPADAEVKNLLAGRSYDVQVIEASDTATRQVIAAELLAAFASRHTEQHERARQAFLDHGYFDEATRDLRTADSPAERAAAARKLGSVRSRLATAHLIAALFDSAPEVRRAAVEALGQIGDPSAVVPLNALLARETSRQVPESTVRQAIESIATVEPLAADTSTTFVAESPANSGAENAGPINVLPAFVTGCRSCGRDASWIRRFRERRSTLAAERTSLTQGRGRTRTSPARSRSRTQRSGGSSPRKGRTGSQVASGC